MRRRSPVFRFVTLAWASLQLAAPAMAGIADGLAAFEDASAPRTHVEATTTEGCPVVHSPDCGLCRYLTTSAAQGASPAGGWAASTTGELVETATLGATCASVALPFGRAPPTI